MVLPLAFRVFLALSEANACSLFRSLSLGRGCYCTRPEKNGETPGQLVLDSLQDTV